MVETSRRRRRATPQRDYARLNVLVPAELMALAHQAAGCSSQSEVVRLALADFAGVDSAAFAVQRGRPKRPQPDTLPLLDETDPIAS